MKTRRLSFALISLFALSFSLLTLFTPSSAQAVITDNGNITGVWLDRSTINALGDHFFDDHNDDTYIYRSTNPGKDGCQASYINSISNNNTKGHLHYYAKSGSATDTNCYEHVNNNLDLSGSVAESNNYFVWHNAKEIDSSDLRKRFVAHDDNASVFYRDGDNECIDTFEASPVGDGRGTLFVRITKGEQAISDNRSTAAGLVGSQYSIDRELNSGVNLGTIVVNGNCASVAVFNVYLGHQPDWATAPVTTVGADGKPIDPANQFDTADGGSGGGCQIDGGLAWIICPIINALQSGVKAVEGVIVGLLTVTPLSTNSGTYTAWQSFKNLANGAFVLIFLIIIFANVTSFNIDAYTVKKMLPRLVLAAIFVQFSFLFMQLAVDISNILGGGIALLFSAIHANQGSGGSTVSAVVGGIELALGGILGLVGVIALGAVVPLLMALLAALIGILATLITLEIRQIFIQVLVILAPIAFVAWILPNTERFFKLWWSNLLKLLLMYPIVVLIISAGNLVAGLPVQTDNWISNILRSLVPIIVLFLIPTTFKMSGTVIAGTAGWIAGRSSRMGKSARTGSLVQNSAASRKNKGLEMYGSSTSAFGKARGRVMSGNALSFGKMGQRKLNAGSAAALDASAKDINEQMQALKTSGVLKDGDLAKLAMGQSVAGLDGKDAAVQQAALQRMVATSDWDGLREANESGKVNAAVLARVKQANYSTIKSKAADIVGGQGGGAVESAKRLEAAGRGMTAEQLASQHHSTLGGLSRNSSPELIAAAKQVLDSSKLSGQLTAKQRSAIESISRAEVVPKEPDASETGAPTPGTPTTPGPPGPATPPPPSPTPGAGTTTT